MTTLANESVGLGVRPALLIVDATMGFADPGSPLGCDGSAALEAIAALLTLFRRCRWPVVYTTNAYADAAEAPVFRRKLPVLNHLCGDGPLAQVHPRIAPSGNEAVLRKIVPSAFFDSPLRQRFFNLGVDTVVVTGFTTSGCVRATAVDAVSCNFRVVVVREACADRDPEAHRANLRDLELKYADVLNLEAALYALSEITGGNTGNG